MPPQALLSSELVDSSFSPGRRYKMSNASWRCALVASLAFFVSASPALSSSEQEETHGQASVAQADALSIGNGPFWGRDRVRKVPAGATSVPLDSGDKDVLAECNSFVDDGKVDRSLLVPALDPTVNWRCRETTSGPLCCGTAARPGAWSDFLPCANGAVPGQRSQDVLRSLRQYDSSSKILWKDIHWHTYNLLSGNGPNGGGGTEILGVGNFIQHEIYSTPGDTGHGNSVIIGPWENSWPLGSHGNVSPVYVNQGVITYDQATGGILTGNFTAKIGRWDWASFDDLLALMDTKICPALGLE
jgi:hypothetical protein